MVHHVQQPSSSVGRVATPASLTEALELLGEYGNRAKPIAGGTDLMIELDRGAHAGVDCLIDLTRIEGFDTIELADAVEPADAGNPGRATLVLGPLVTHNRCVTSTVVRQHGLPLAQACLEVGSPPLRNRATVIGNIVTASPANDTISALMVLDAELTLQSVRGTRTVPLVEFYTGVRSTVLQADELVTAVRTRALGEDWRAVYVKSGLRRAQAISVVHSALACRVDDSGVIVEARVAVGSVAPTVVRLDEVERALVGQPLNADSAGELATHVAALAGDAVEPIDDVRSTAAYRSDQLSQMIRRAVVAVAEGQQGEAIAERPVTLFGSTAGRWPSGPALATDHQAGAAISATVNGALSVGSTPGDSAAGSLLDWLRQQGFSGVKEGCAEGECGACTIHLDSMAVLSCLVPATRAHGATVVTIEGLAAASSPHGASNEEPDALAPLQSAFVESGSVQCGYCIPGFLMAAAKLTEEPAAESLSKAEVAAGMSGNLCRCTGYYKITDAIMSTLSRSDAPLGGDQQENRQAS